MNKVDKILVKYVLWAVPFVIILVFSGMYFGVDELSSSGGLTRTAWDILGWIFMVWILVAFYLTVRMVFSTTVRNHILAKLARVKERDERESEIAGNAAKFSFLSTLAWMLLFLFLNVFTVTIARTPNTQLNSDKHGYIKMGMGFKPYDFGSNKTETTDKDGKVIVSYNELPLTKACLMLFLILWQVGSYQYIARRELLGK